MSADTWGRRLENRQRLGQSMEISCVIFLSFGKFLACHLDFSPYSDFPSNLEFGSMSVYKQVGKIVTQICTLITDVAIYL